MRIVPWVVLGMLALAMGCGPKQPQTPKPQPPKTEVTGEGVVWMTTFEEAMKQAKQEGKPMMMDVMASWCSACKRLDKDVWSRSDVAELSKSYVTVKVDADERGDIKTKYAVSGLPTTLFLTPDGEEISRVRGAVPYENMLKAMRGVLDKAKPAK
jgi:thiol:disulfide interchange protein DsbD